MEYDLIVIGSGPGGYVAAIRAGQLGLKTALVEKYSTLGGTCLNVGCIPSKALLDSSEHYHNANKHFDTHGIGTGKLSINFAKMLERKNAVVSQTTQGIVGLMAKNKVDVHHGMGSFVDSQTIKIDSDNGETKEIRGKKIIIATGSKPFSIPGVEVDKKRVITSTEALGLPEIPKTMIVIGGGAIGLELGSVYARLGTKVQVVEYMDNIIPNMDKECGRVLMRSLKKIGVEFFLKHAVKEVSVKGKTVTLKADDLKKKKEVQFKGDYVLVATGRKAFTEGLNLDAAGITIDSRGKVPVNNVRETSSPGIFAIGDVVEGVMLAHKAEEEGVAVVEYIAGQPFHLNHNTIPGVVYTWPEAAAVGKSEEELKNAGISYKSGSFPFKASGRARAAEETDGFVKILSDKETDEILGVHMVGPRAADMIGECVVAMEYRASAEDIGRICHAHPTFSEAIKEAALGATDNRALHI
jgi:dihydrolipoamide dehydrogenase